MTGAELDQQLLDARGLRAARQLLRTDLLLGVDFVPMGPAWPGEPDADRGKVFDHLAPAPAVVTRAIDGVRPPVVPAPVRAAPPAPPPRPAQPSAAPAPAPAMVEAKPRNLSPKQQASHAQLEALRQKYEQDAPHSAFVTDHHCIVFGDGDPCARLMIIGEAPGAEEDKVGIPFVGRAGQLLEKMLGAMGLHRSEVYITNVLKTRPPNNATPTADEAAACAPYLFDQIRIVSPEVILALGLPATRVLLNTADSMSRLRGRWWTYSDPRTLGTGVPVMPTYHPAFLLRSYTRENREKVWSDLRMVMDRLGLKGPRTLAAQV